MAQLAMELVNRLAKFLWENDAYVDQDDITLSYYGNIPSYCINCNDWECWGSSDAEDITDEFLDAWQLSIDEIKAALANEGKIACWKASRSWSHLLAVSKVRGTRPQGCWYKYKGKVNIPPKLWHLFNACGSHREAGLGNPVATPTDEEIVQWL